MLFRKLIAPEMIPVREMDQDVRPLEEDHTNLMTGKVFVIHSKLHDKIVRNY